MATNNTVFHLKERLVEPVVPTKASMISVGAYLARRWNYVNFMWAGNNLAWKFLRIAEAGCGHYFTVPGDFTLALLDEFLKEPGLTMVGCCNELNAGYAADGYCRATKGLGVVMGNYRNLIVL
jgi:hypothetical protein